MHAEIPLYVIGLYEHFPSILAGVALGKCVEYGYTLARELAQYLDSDGSAAHIAGPETAQDEAFYQGEIPVTVSQRN